MSYLILIVLFLIVAVCISEAVARKKARIEDAKCYAPEDLAAGVAFASAKDKYLDLKGKVYKQLYPAEHTALVSCLEGNIANSSHESEYTCWLFQEMQKDTVNFSENQPFSEKIRISNYVTALVKEWEESKATDSTKQ